MWHFVLRRFWIEIFASEKNASFIKGLNYGLLECLIKLLNHLNPTQSCPMSIRPDGLIHCAPPSATDIVCEQPLINYCQSSCQLKSSDFPQFSCILWVVENYQSKLSEVQSCFFLINFLIVSFRPKMPQKGPLGAKTNINVIFVAVSHSLYRCMWITACEEYEKYENDNTNNS